jgi:CheY-like chemotaxis protein
LTLIDAVARPAVAQKLQHAFLSDGVRGSISVADFAIPIIGMSAHAVESEREQAIATGCDEFDAKPIEFESLVATIRRVLAPHK